MKVLIILATLEVTTIEVSDEWIERGYVNVPRKVSAVAVSMLTGREVESPFTPHYDCYEVGRMRLGSSVRPMLSPVGMRQDTINRIAGDWLAALYDREVNA